MCRLNLSHAVEIENTFAALSQRDFLFLSICELRIISLIIIIMLENKIEFSKV